MKRRMSSPLLLLLAATVALMLFGASSVFAAESGSFQVTTGDASAPATSSIAKATQAQAKKLTTKAKTIKYADTVYAGGTYDLTEGENGATPIYCGTTYNKTDTWFKITPSKTGYIVTSEYDGYIQLCNSSKKAISDSYYVRAESSSLNVRVFGVKAGKTYYLKVSSAGSYDSNLNCYKNSVAYQSYSSNQSYGTSKKPAKLTKSKTKKGYLVYNGSAKYYKFTKKKTKTVKVYLTTYTDKTIKYKVTAKAKGCKTYTTTISGSSYNNGTPKKLTLSKTGKKGTIKVTIKAYRSGNSSGGYSIKCK